MRTSENTKTLLIESIKTKYTVLLKKIDDDLMSAVNKLDEWFLIEVTDEKTKTHLNLLLRHLRYTTINVNEGIKVILY